MRTKSIILLSTASALAIPAAASACDLEGPGSRFSAFAHMTANPDPAPPQADTTATTRAPYKDDSRDPQAAQPTPVDYNAPSAPAPADDVKPADEAVTR